MPEGALLLAFVTGQRLIELAFARRNAKRLRAEGAVEFGRTHYPLIVLLHGIWLVGLWVLARHRPVEPALLAVFAMLQLARLWTLATLGRRWTTRVLVLPGAALVSAGPYRLLRHPNYLVVVAEIAIVPLALGLPLYAAAFSLMNAALLFHRVRVEEAALAWAAAQPR